MNNYFAKTILYAYPVIDDVIEQIDELKEKRAIFSMDDTSPAITQCEKIVDFNVQKAVLYIIKKSVDKILQGFSEEELLLLDYKFFKKKDRSCYESLDYLSRTYFRKQIKVLSKFIARISQTSIDDCWFKEHCLSIDFFKSLLKIVIEKDVYSYKNKKLIDKSERKEYDKKVLEIYRKMVAWVLTRIHFQYLLIFVFIIITNFSLWVFFFTQYYV